MMAADVSSQDDSIPKIIVDSLITMANLENNYDNEKEQEQSTKEEVSIENARELVKDAVQNPVETAKEFTEQAAKDVTNVKWWAKLLLILFWVGLALVATFFIIINLDSTKRWAANQALQVLNQDFKAEMTQAIEIYISVSDILFKRIALPASRGGETLSAYPYALAVRIR